MPAYLITHAESRRGDVLVEADDLTLTLTERWARLTDTAGIVLAVPVEQVASVQRVDAEQGDPEEQESALHEG